MFIEPLVGEGLDNSSYLVASEAAGLAAVVDPQRDVNRYLPSAEGLGLRLLYALDTHLHNDFVSGVRELAALAGVQIGASALAGLGFDHRPVGEGDTLPLGVLATPGHTPEHISFTVTAGGQTAPAAVFTGGAPMVGGAARTSLLGAEWTTRLSARDGLVLVDVRQAAEWQAGHVPGALHIEAGQPRERRLALDLATPIAVHCGHHDRSATGLALLEQQGFGNLLLMDGGFTAWQAAGYDVEHE